MNIDIYKQDCIEGLSNLEPESVDIFITSPPYNLGVKYNSYKDDIPRQDYLKWTKKWASLVKRALKENGSFFLNMGGKPTDPWVPMEVAMTLKDQFHLQNHIHWIKSISIDGVTTGQFKPITSNRFVNDCHEDIFHFTKTGHINVDRLAIGVPQTDKSNIKRWSSGKDIRCRGNTWFIKYQTVQSKKEHPAAFPEELPELCIKFHGVKNPLVCDPFLGRGSTGIACCKLGVSFIGFEIDEYYYNLALKNIRTAFRCSPSNSLLQK